MCTLTVSRDAERLRVTMNRDEARSRAEEHPPTRTAEGGSPPILCPRDGQRGGTWIGVNGAGLVGCLLNLYEAENPDAPPARTTSWGAEIFELEDPDGIRVTFLHWIDGQSEA